MRDLSALEKEIFDLREKGTSLKEIGEAFNLKRERIREIEARARRKLRDQERKGEK